MITKLSVALVLLHKCDVEVTVELKFTSQCCLIYIIGFVAVVLHAKYYQLTIHIFVSV